MIRREPVITPNYQFRETQEFVLPFQWCETQARLTIKTANTKVVEASIEVSKIDPYWPVVYGSDWDHEFFAVLQEFVDDMSEETWAEIEPYLECRIVNGIAKEAA